MNSTTYIGHYTQKTVPKNQPLIHVMRDGYVVKEGECLLELIMPGTQVSGNSKFSDLAYLLVTLKL